MGSQSITGHILKGVGESLILGGHNLIILIQKFIGRIDEAKLNY